MRARLIIPVISEQEASSIPIARNEIVTIAETGKTYKGDGVKLLEELAEVNAFDIETGETTNATPTTIATILITDYTTGIIEVRATASNNLYTLNGIKVFAFEKIGGTLTLTGSNDLLTDAGAIATGGASWDGNSTAGDFTIDATGIAATVIDWKFYYKITSLALTPP